MFIERQEKKIKESVINKTIKDIKIRNSIVEIIFDDDTEMDFQIDLQAERYNVLLDEKFYSR